MCGVLLPAQPSSKPAGGGLRALALLEVGSNGRARLVPIALKVGEKFYDASLYRADPRPLALDPGVVYEAERSGDSVGLFTVTQAQKVKDLWVGLGQWRSNAALEAEREKKVVATRPVPEKDERPILRKRQSGSATPGPSASATPTPSAPPSPTVSASATPSISATPSPSPTPTPKPAESARNSSPTFSSVDEDPSRPILRRGKPAGHAESDELAPAIEAKPGASRSTPGIATAGTTGAASEAVEVFAAISDAAGPKPHPYLMQLKPEERAKYEQSLRQMAYDATVKFAATRPPHKPGTIDRIEDSHVEVYDTHDNNEPDLVFSAALPEQLSRGASSAFRYFVTVVARVDMYGDMRQLLVNVTDSSRLDEYPRLELIDAVDAEGSGSAQMLFRRVSDTGYDYVLYRVGLDKLWPLFEGAGSEGK
jgi:hypothetical protein